jgi:peptidoglycan/xylan/chitin deacetylase (PgdA/CDA1 family)
MNSFIRRMATAMHRALCFIVYFTGFHQVISFLKRRQPVILMYHSVNDRQCPHVYPDNIVSVETFERQIRYLAREKNVISLEDLVERVRNRETLPLHTVAITFDDGYYDFYSTAYPLLKRNKLPCTLFLATKLLDIGETKWEDTLTHILNSATADVLRLRLDGRDRTWVLTTSEKRQDCIVEIVDAFHNAGDTRTQVLREVEHQMYLSKGTPPQVMMGWKEVLELAEDPHLAFGCHSHSHLNLGDISPDQAKEEIETSKEQIEHHLQRECRLFCYPFGKKSSFTPHVKTLLKALGFAAAVTTIPGNVTRDADPFELRRIAAIEDASYRFKCALIGLTLQRG